MMDDDPTWFMNVFYEADLGDDGSFLFFLTYWPKCRRTK